MNNNTTDKDEKLQEGAAINDVIIIDLVSVNRKEDSCINIDLRLLDSAVYDLKETGSLWLLVMHQRTSDALLPYGFELAQYLMDRGLVLRNIITWFVPYEYTNAKRLTNRYAHIYFLVRDADAYVFDKDKIREKHIWKDVEWGKRTKRYHPLGKDPGNVWLMTEDDGEGNKLKHIPLSIDNVVDRITLAACPPNGRCVLYSGVSVANSDIIIYPIDGFIARYSEPPGDSAKVDVNRATTKKELFYKVFNRTSEYMHDLRDEEVDLIVTSPPYWDMKDYGIEDQIGYAQTYDRYLARIKKVWQECYRVLSKQGTFWLNINTKTYRKSLCMIQYDFYRQCKNIGFKLWDIIIWHKSVSGPASGNNLTDKFEYVLVFYKQPGFYFNKSYELTKKDYLIASIKGMGNVWNINRFWGSIGKNYPHPAMYPEELIERILHFGSKKYDLVMDPFLGAGTTLVVAKKLLRSCAGYEINAGYFNIFKKRLFEERYDGLFEQDQAVQFLR